MPAYGVLLLGVELDAAVYLGFGDGSITVPIFGGGAMYK
jgi:hypothetical protein